MNLNKDLNDPFGVFIKDNYAKKRSDNLNYKGDKLHATFNNKKDAEVYAKIWNNTSSKNEQSIYGLK